MSAPDKQVDRERRLRMRAARILADEGLRLDPGLSVMVVKGGEVVITDPPTAGNSATYNPRKAIRLPGTFSDDGIVERLAAFARESIRRKVMEEAYRAAKERRLHAPGWTSLAHPVAIALMARMQVPLNWHPGNKSENVSRQMMPKGGSYNTVRTWDILSINVSGTITGTYVSLETKSGQAWLQIDGRFPHTLIDTLPGRPLAAVLGIPRLARYGVPDIVRRHALAVDAAVAASTIHTASDGLNHLSIELEPTTWLPFGPPPDDGIERTLALNFEKH